jgi:hypothetical protein
MSSRIDRYFKVTEKRVQAPVTGVIIFNRAWDDLEGRIHLRASARVIRPRRRCATLRLHAQAFEQVKDPYLHARVGLAPLSEMPLEMFGVGCPGVPT